MRENSLQLQVESALLQDRLTEDSDIEVLDNNGVVTLRGTVPNREARDRAEVLAREVSGVTTVINELDRSEEHTSELQSLTNLVCRLLLEKKKNITDYGV